jgi:hypothetical protein
MMAPENMALQNPQMGSRWPRKLMFDAMRQRPIFGHLVGNVVWLLIERGFLLITGLFVDIWFVKYLGPTAFGSWFLDFVSRKSSVRSANGALV